MKKIDQDIYITTKSVELDRNDLVEIISIFEGLPNQKELRI